MIKALKVAQNKGTSGVTNDVQCYLKSEYIR